MLRQSWSIRIEAPKPPRPSPPPTASKMAHWAGIPHYRLPRFNLADEAMLQELQTEELDEEDYSLLSSRTSTIKKPRHEVELVNVPDRKGFSDRAPKARGGKLRKSKLSKEKQAAVSNQNLRQTKAPEPADSRVIPGDVNDNKTLPADFDSNSTEYPRHPRTPDRYMLSLSRASSGRERRNSLSSASDHGRDRIADRERNYNESVKAPIALRKSPPQFLQNWDDDNPYTYAGRPYDLEHSYLPAPRQRPSTRSMSMASSSRLPILHESRHEVSADDEYGMMKAQTMPSSIQQVLDQPQSRYHARNKDPSTSSLTQINNPPRQTQVQTQQNPLPHVIKSTPSVSSAEPSPPTADFSPDEPALTEMSTEILIGGERTGKRSHPQPVSVEEWVQRIGTPVKASGTPKTIPSTDVEVEEGPNNSDKDRIWEASPLHEEIENPEVPIPVPTKTTSPTVPIPSRTAEATSIVSTPSPRPTDDTTKTEDEGLVIKWPGVEDIRASRSLMKVDLTERSTPVTVIQIPPPIEASLPPPLPPPPVQPPPPVPTEIPANREERPPSPLSGPVATFTLDPKEAQKRRMTVAFGITPLQRRETAELAQDVMRRVSSVSTVGRRGSLASVIRIVDVLLVKEREEQLKQARRAEMLWD
ncbi:hypothetical protein AA313_de0209243 [Arthrobotrys entomopaga]|nr:hypothetical protein AA313_de0209243 [Arthrobotrys entomopaga]